jgi:hypothetical protein
MRKHRPVPTLTRFEVALITRVRSEGSIGYYGLGAVSEPPTYVEKGARRKGGPRVGCGFKIKSLEAGVVKIS